MTELLNTWVGGALSWLWNWTEFLSYWVAAIGGSASYILYFTTKDRKYAAWTIGLIVGYVLICVIGSVL